MVYRFDIRYPANRGGYGPTFRLMITAQDGASYDVVHQTFVSEKPTMADVRKYLAAKGFEAYGDMAVLSGGTIRSMIRPAAK